MRYEVVYVLLTCLQGAALLGMAMLDPQRDKDVTIMLFPPDQTVLDVLHLKSDLGTHVPTGDPPSKNEGQHADVDVLWGADGTDIADQKKVATKGGAEDLKLPKTKVALFGRPDTPHTGEGLRRRGVSAITKGTVRGVSAITKGTVQSLIQKFAVLEAEGDGDEPATRAPKRGSTASGCKSDGSGGGGFDSWAALPPAPTASQVVYLGGGGGGLASRQHTYESIKSVPSHPADYPANITKEAEAKQAKELIAGAARRRQSDAAATKAAEAEGLLEAVRIAQDLLASSRGGADDGVATVSRPSAFSDADSGESSVKLVPRGGLGGGAPSMPATLALPAPSVARHASYAANVAGREGGGRGVLHQPSSMAAPLGAADEAALLIATAAASESRHASPSKKRFGSLKSGEEGGDLVAELATAPGLLAGSPPSSRRPSNPTATVLMAITPSSSPEGSPPPPPPPPPQPPATAPLPAPFPTETAAAVAAAASTTNNFAMTQIAADLAAMTPRTSTPHVGLKVRLKAQQTATAAAAAEAVAQSRSRQSSAAIDVTTNGNLEARTESRVQSVDNGTWVNPRNNY